MACTAQSVQDDFGLCASDDKVDLQAFELAALELPAVYDACRATTIEFEVLRTLVLTLEAASFKDLLVAVPNTTMQQSAAMHALNLAAIAAADATSVECQEYEDLLLCLTVFFQIIGTYPDSVIEGIFAGDQSYVTRDLNATLQSALCGKEVYQPTEGDFTWWIATITVIVGTAFVVAVVLLYKSTVDRWHETFKGKGLDFHKGWKHD